jgi:hypothetical protein
LFDWGSRYKTRSELFIWSPEMQSSGVKWEMSRGLGLAIGYCVCLPWMHAYGLEDHSCKQRGVPKCQKDLLEQVVELEEYSIVLFLCN